MAVNLKDRATLDKACQMHQEARRLSAGEPGADGVMTCLCCGGKVHYHVSQSGRRLSALCQTDGCLHWSGGLRYD